MSDSVAVGVVAELDDRNKHSRCILVCVTVVVTVVGISCVLQSFLKVDNCLQILDDGYWTSDGLWRCNWCILHQYQEEEIAACLNRWENIVVIGGKAATEYSKLLKEFQPLMKGKVELFFHPAINEQTLQEYDHIFSKIKTSGSVLVLHRPEMFVSSDDLQEHGIKESCRENLNSLQKAQSLFLEKLVQRGQIILMTPEVEMFESSSDYLVNSCLQSIQKSFNASQPLLKYLSLPLPDNSVSVHPISQELNFVCNYLCNSPDDSTCCVNEFQVSLVVYISISLIIAILAFYLGVYLIFASGATFALTPYLEARSFDLNKFFLLLHSVGGVAASLLYMQMVDRLDYFIRGPVHSQHVFCGILILGFIALAILTIKASDYDQILSPDQCSEWRGWMMILFILIRYFDLEKMFVGSSILDLITGGFLFLSGFCHFSNYLHNKETVTWKRSAQVLVTLNFIPVCVCISLNSSYGLYFLLPLLSMSYILVVVFIKSFPRIQPSPVAEVNKFKITTLKFLIFGFILSVLPFLKDTIIDALVQSDNVSASTYLVQLERQRFVPFWGMVVAYVFSVIKSSYTSTITKYQSILRPFAVVSGIFIFFVFVVVNKFQSSLFQAHSSILPLLSYVLLRNGFTSLQRHTSLLMKEVGTVSIWLFVSHYHILMAFDGRGLLVLLPDLYVLNTLLVVLVYVMITFIIHRSQQTLKLYFFV